MQKQTWRDYLKELIADRNLHQELARELRVNPATLARWTWLTKKVEPQRGHLERLLSSELLSISQRDTLVTLLKEEYSDPRIEDRQQPVRQNEPLELIPNEFYRLILRSRSTTNSQEEAYNTIVQLVQQQIKSHLQPIHTSLLLLTPPRQNQPIRSLYHPMRPYGHHPGCMPQMCPIFVGIEFSMSIVFASNSARPFVFTEKEIQYDMKPAFVEFQNTKSALIVPLQQCNKVGGCFLLMSDKSGYFYDSQHVDIAVEYSNLLSLALDHQTFFDAKGISFCLLAPIEEQLRKEQEFSFMSRMKRLQGQSLSPYAIEVLERLALQQLEDELIQIKEG